MRDTGYIDMEEILLIAVIVSLLPRLSKRVCSGGEIGGGGGKKDGNSGLGLARLCLCLAFIETPSLSFEWARTAATLSVIMVATGTGFHGA